MHGPQRLGLPLNACGERLPTLPGHSLEPDPLSQPGGLGTRERGGFKPSPATLQCSSVRRQLSGTQTPGCGSIRFLALLSWQRSVLGATPKHGK